MSFRFGTYSLLTPALCMFCSHFRFPNDHLRFSLHVKMVDSRLDRIFEGCFEGLTALVHPRVRVYLSSTYTDMSLEKSVLSLEVFPKVKEYCRER